MKKTVIIPILFILIFLCGCSLNTPQYMNLSKKPSNNYYSSQLYMHLKANSKYIIYVFDTNICKNIEISKDETDIISNFIQSLKSQNYIVSYDEDKKETFRIKIVFDNDTTYLIKVFDNQHAAILPWDGVYSEDFINMSDIPAAYNLYDFCSHVHNKPSSI